MVQPTRDVVHPKGPGYELNGVYTVSPSAPANVIKEYAREAVGLSGRANTR